MNCVKISEAEYPLMEYIWEHAPISASALAAYSQDAFHWKKNTTYTVIKRLTLRGALERQEPGFIVTPLVTKQQVQQSELENLCNRIFAGSSKDFILSFISRENVSEEELAQIRQTVNEYHR